jgi:hypothetical protein
MAATLFKRLVIYFGLAILICLMSLIISIIYEIDAIFVISAVLISFACISEITFTAFFYSGNKKFRKVVYLLIPFCSAFAVVSGFFQIDILTIILSFVAFLAASVAIYIFNGRRTTLFLYIFISLIFTGIIFKRFHLPLAGIILTASSVLFSVGIFIFGITSLFNMQKNKYLLILILVCSTILAIDGMAAVFKMQHWPGGGIMIQTSIVAIILVTIITLLTLPQSGYFNWPVEHRKSFYRNIVVPWIVAASFIAYYFLIPQTTKEIIFPPRYETGAHFNMFPYELEQPDTADMNK